MVCKSDKHDKSSSAGFSCSAQVEFWSLAIVKNNGWLLAPWLYADRVYSLCKVTDKQLHRKTKEEFSFESHKRNWFSEWGIHLKREDCKHFNSYGLKGKTCEGAHLYIDKLQHCGPLLFIIQQHLLITKKTPQRKLTGGDCGKHSREFVMANRSPRREDFFFGSKTLLHKLLSTKSLRSSHGKQRYL